jgi:hypothetical protein
MTHFQHQSLANGKWFQMSLVEQLGNIGSEINRTINARDNEKRFEGAVTRALELFDLTLSDPRWRTRLKEITRAREIFCDIIFGDNQYETSLEDLNRYFYYFAYAARSNK